MDTIRVTKEDLAAEHIFRDGEYIGNEQRIEARFLKLLSVSP